MGNNKSDFLLTYNINKNIQNRGDVFDIGLWCEKQPVCEDLKSKLDAHKNHETVLCDLQCWDFHHAISWCLEHHGEARHGGSKDHYPIKQYFKAYQGNYICIRSTYCRLLYWTFLSFPVKGSFTFVSYLA